MKPISYKVAHNHLDTLSLDDASRLQDWIDSTKGRTRKYAIDPIRIWVCLNKAEVYLANVVGNVRDRIGAIAVISANEYGPYGYIRYKAMQIVAIRHSKTWTIDSIDMKLYHHNQVNQSRVHLTPQQQSIAIDRFKHSLYSTLDVNNPNVIIDNPNLILNDYVIY